MVSKDYRRRLDNLLADYRHAALSVKEEKEALMIAKGHLKAVGEALSIVRAAAEQIQMQAHQKIAGVITRCLETVFGEDAYTFLINFIQRRNKTEAELTFVRDGMEIDPMSSCGGGVVDVASFSLRLSCLMLMRPIRRRLLILDEPMKFLSASYRPRVRMLLEELARELDLQIIFVTHSKELVCGKIIEID